MLKGLDINRRIEFVSSKDTAEPKTVFVLKPLSGEDRANFLDNGTVRLSGTKMYDFLETSVVEIRNFDIEGDIRKKLISIEDDEVIAELVNEIGKISNMTRQDQKN